MRSPPSSMLSGDLRSGNWSNPHLFSACLYWKTDLDTHSTWDKSDPNWTNLTDSEILRRYADDGSMYSGSYEDQNSGSYWPCVVIREEAHTKSSEPTFTVRMLQIPFEDDTTWTKNRLPRFLTNYSRSSIQFFVRRGMGDQYLPGVFRHKIGIPDDVFPSHWKNKAE